MNINWGIFYVDREKYLEYAICGKQDRRYFRFKTGKLPFIRKKQRKHSALLVTLLFCNLLVFTLDGEGYHSTVARVTVV